MPSSTSWSVVLAPALIALILTGCGGSGAAAPREAPPHPESVITDTSAASSQGTVGARVSAGPRVQIIAVVYDAHGERSTIDLGTYEGEWKREPPTGEELVRGSVQAGPDAPALRVIVSE
jgi:hypothetical protein